MARAPQALARQPERDPAEDLRRREKIAAIVDRLQRLADEQVQKKSTIEDRWYEDLRQYYGRYDADTEAKLRAANRSRVWVGLTRSSTHAWEARLADMLFPTDDKNWGIKPTPVPDLAQAARVAVDEALAAEREANAAMRQGQPEQAQAIAQQHNARAEEAKRARAILDEAQRRAEAMEREIEDQLRECDYGIVCRDAIHDSVKLGTGIIKGPLIRQKPRRSWQKLDDGLYQLTVAGDPRLEFRRVDPWAYFPDMSARTPDEREFDFERHLMTKAELRKLAQMPGFDQDAIRSILRDEPREGLPPYVAKLRDITGGGQDSLRDRYWVWEYSGPLETEDLVILADATGDEDLIADIADDPLIEVRATVWFCQGHLLKFGLHPLDSGESLYSVFPFERDDTSIFGMGVPFLMRDSQAALNAAWRMTLDNAGLSSGPQVVVNRDLVEPANGSWTLEPRKIWYRKNSSSVRPGASAFETYHIESRQDQLAGIIAHAIQFAEMESNMPPIARGGEAGVQKVTTAQGLAMLLNSANVVFRRVVKNFDDTLTVPTIRRAYDWNMQFSRKEHIKGDFDVDARGSSVLLVRDLQSQSLMTMAVQFAAHPVLGPLIKHAPLLRKLAQAQMLSADDIVLTDDEIEAATARAQQEGAPPDPEMMKLEIQLTIARETNATNLEIARLAQERAMLEYAGKQNIEVEKVNAMLADRQADRRHKERMLAAEFTAQRRDPTASGGGYL